MVEEILEEIKSEYEGWIVVHRDTKKVIARADDSHELTKILQEKEYDEERALIIRGYAN